jgi:ABC-type cobalt transport system substrate-binding protein
MRINIALFVLLVLLLIVVVFGRTPAFGESKKIAKYTIKSITKSITPITKYILPIRSGPNITDFLWAINKQETGGKAKCNDHRDSNGRIVKGAFQISYRYWKDAYQHNPSIGGNWDRCRYDREYSKKVVLAYLDRYCPHALSRGNWEVLARTHNGGPSGPLNRLTAKYWRSVKKYLDVF